jgi:SAM-dependent methyltransferase
VSDWDAYYRTVASREPRTTLVAALRAAGDGDGRLAIDLGCGDGTDTIALLDAGFRVLAVDSSPDFPRFLLPRVPDDQRDRLEVLVGDFRTVELPPCDLVHAGFSLFFCPAADFEAMWGRIRAALRPGAILSCHLLGPNDSWATRPDCTAHDRHAVEALLSGLYVDQLDEEEKDGWSCSGEKHWHLWHVLARA